ncbi:hypothetical protein [Chroococcidiopsis sp. CCNUC1]|uniref:hypothetical protein n=1 Tax=Chroococcidiopsis sp. CCNUC1 TaxID=2653189 RepID=UPI0020222635|nr:hypothetical protein [Chroococcidiopsis sp. CCNUC1]URD51873.1 hypothetical protein M5J74_07740 [Chroococcidiopsis sp. CCNUC1]
MFASSSERLHGSLGRVYLKFVSRADFFGELAPTFNAITAVHARSFIINPNQRIASTELIPNSVHAV